MSKPEPGVIGWMAALAIGGAAFLVVVLLIRALVFLLGGG